MEKLPNQTPESSQSEDEKWEIYDKKLRQRNTEKFKLTILWIQATKYGFVTFDQIKELAPKHIIEANQLDQIATYLTDLGVHVCKETPTEEEIKKLPKPDIDDGYIHINSSDPTMHGAYGRDQLRFISRFMSGSIEMPPANTEAAQRYFQKIIEKILD